MPFLPIPEALEVIKKGEFLIVLDDDQRENEGDLVMAAQWITPAAVNFMAKHGRGLICAPMTAEAFNRFQIPMMVAKEKNQSSHATPFGISVEARTGVTTGISAFDRARTLQVLADPKACVSDISMPGHIFPLRAEEKGVLARPGHTEAAVDLARMAGCDPTGVICEILNEDGTMARRPDLEAFSKEHRIPMITIEDLIAYRKEIGHDETPCSVELVSEANIPTSFGFFQTKVYRDRQSGMEHVAFFLGDVSKKDTLVRLHSECLTGDVFGSLRCDCGDQLRQALKSIHDEGHGVLVYLRQEGRGIGLGNKIKAYALQEKGLDTVEANLELGFPEDLRSYQPGADILKDLGVTAVRLLTNNPLKVEGLECYGVKVVERVPVVGQLCATNHHYIKTKVEKMGHLLNPDDLSTGEACNMTQPDQQTIQPKKDEPESCEEQKELPHDVKKRSQESQNIPEELPLVLSAFY